jgi:SAM-dependent methyltransferase
MSNFKDHFSERAARYAAYRPHYPPVLADYLAAIAPARGIAWDAGCGSGQLSTLLGDRFDRVIATDASAAQIGGASPHPHVEYEVAPAEHTSIADSSVDLIAAAQAAHWFDLPRFYDEARRVARPGAAIALVAYGRTGEITPEVDAVIEELYAGVLGKWWPPERRHPESGYRHLDFPFPELDAPEVVMEADWTVDELIGYIGTWSAVRAMESADGPSAMEGFSERIRAAWGQAGWRRVTWPLAVRAGRIDAQ